MKKTISMMLTVVLCMGLFAGCGDKSPKPPKEVTEIVDAINKKVIEDRQTTKENFELTEAFVLDDNEYFVYESSGIYLENGKEYKTTIKLKCNDKKIRELNVFRDQSFGLNIRTVEVYMRDIRTDFKKVSNNLDSLTYQRQ